MILKKKLIFNYTKQAPGDFFVKTNTATDGTTGTRLEETTKQDLAKPDIPKQDLPKQALVTPP